MDYQGYSGDSLLKLYEGVREALASDEVHREQGSEGKYRVRKTPAWKLHAADLEAEMLRRGMMFELIEWYQPDAPVEEMPAPSAVPEHEEMQRSAAGPELAKMREAAAAPKPAKMHGPAAAPEPAPAPIEPSMSQMVLTSLGQVDVLGQAEVSTVAAPAAAKDAIELTETKEKPQRKRRGRASGQRA